MLISKLIKELQALKRKHGDIKVMFEARQRDYCCSTDYCECGSYPSSYDYDYPTVGVKEVNKEQAVVLSEY